MHAFEQQSPKESDDAHLLDKDLFEDDITQQGKDINQYSSPLFMIVAQNKICSKIIQREKQNYQEKKMLKNDRIALIVNQGNLNEFFRKKVRGNQDVALPVRLFSNVFGFITSLPAHVVRKVEKSMKGTSRSGRPHRSLRLGLQASLASAWS